MKTKKPESVKVIGWTWVILGLMLLWIGGFSVILADAGELDKAGIAETIAPWVQLVIGCIAIPSAILFMRQNRISRKILLTLSWLLTVGIIGVGVGWLIVFSQNSPEPAIIAWMLSGFILVMFIYGIPMFFMLKALHGRLPRDAFEHSKK